MPPLPVRENGTPHLRKAKTFSEDQVFQWGLELSDTLTFVHSKGIVHHDIKPANILFADDGSIKLGDFGVANCNIGTIIFLPPEMLRREPVSRTDPRVDVYALGLTLLELLVGQHPFAGLDERKALALREDHDFVPKRISRWAREIILKATHPVPEFRFQTAADLADAIRGKHVPNVFTANHLEADALARKAEAAIGRKKWNTAKKLAKDATEISRSCVAAWLARGRCALLNQSLAEANDHFSTAVSISPHTPVQKELGWINLDYGRIPMAISLLTDHLQRNASDYEAYNLLLKCYYLTNRFEAGEALAKLLLGQKSPHECFYNNLLICKLLEGTLSATELRQFAAIEPTNPFVDYNITVATEKPGSWERDKGPTLKSKLLFQEFRFRTSGPTGKRNSITIATADGRRHCFDQPIISIGSLGSNDVVLENPSVSRRHCLIVNFHDDVWLYDLESACHTFVDDQVVNGRVFLDLVHRARIGDVGVQIGASKGVLVGAPR